MAALAGRWGFHLFSRRRALGAGFPGCDEYKKTTDGALSALHGRRRILLPSRAMGSASATNVARIQSAKATSDAPRDEAASGDRANCSGTETTRAKRLKNKCLHLDTRGIVQNKYFARKANNYHEASRVHSYRSSLWSVISKSIPRHNSIEHT